MCDDKKQKLLSSNTIVNLSDSEVPLPLVCKFPVRGKPKFVLGAGPQASLFYSGNLSSNSLYVLQANPDSAVRYRFTETVNDDLPVGKSTSRYRVLHFGAKAFGEMEFGLVHYRQLSRDLNEFYEENSRTFKAEMIGASQGIYLGQPAKKEYRPKSRNG